MICHKLEESNPSVGIETNELVKLNDSEMS